ncbi:MAG: cation transporter [Pseudomonadota bacterium]
MKRLLIITGGAFALAAGGFTVLASASAPVKAATAHTRTARFAVANITCATCPITVKRAMRKVPGVQSVDVSFEKKTAVVVFDPSRTRPSAIVAASTGVGFPAKLVR